MIVGHRIELLDEHAARGAVYCRAEHEVGDRWIVMGICYFDDYQRVDRAAPGRDFDSWGTSGGRPALPHSLPTWTAFWSDEAAVADLTGQP